MKVLRLFAFYGFALSLVFFNTGFVAAQATRWEMLDGDTLDGDAFDGDAVDGKAVEAEEIVLFSQPPVLNEFHQPEFSQQEIPPHAVGASTRWQSQPSWSFDAAFLALTRNDEHRISFGTLADPRIVEMQSDSNLGVRMSVSRLSDEPRRQSETSTWEGSFLFARDENAYPIAAEQWVVSSQLMTAEVNGGIESSVFGVRTRMMVGARYANVADQYDRYIGVARMFDDDFVATQNHAGYAQGKMGLQWERGRWSVAAALAGGFGVNASHQEGDVFGSPMISAYEVDQFSFSMLTEAMANVNLRLFSQTQLQFGLYGLSLSEMAASRRSLGGEGDLDDARYFGLTIGVQQCF